MKKENEYIVPRFAEKEILKHLEGFSVTRACLPQRGNYPPAVNLTVKNPNGTCDLAIWLDDHFTVNFSEYIGSFAPNMQEFEAFLNTLDALLSGSTGVLSIVEQQIYGILWQGEMPKDIAAVDETIPMDEIFCMLEYFGKGKYTASHVRRISA